MKTGFVDFLFSIFDKILSSLFVLINYVNLGVSRMGDGPRIRDRTTPTSFGVRPNAQTTDYDERTDHRRNQ